MAKGGHGSSWVPTVASRSSQTHHCEWIMYGTHTTPLRIRFETVRCESLVHCAVETSVSGSCLDVCMNDSRSRRSSSKESACVAEANSSTSRWSS